MWRFLLAGLVTVCGVILLFMASFGDPHMALRGVTAALPLVWTRSPQLSAAPVAGPAVAQASPTAPVPVAVTGPDTVAWQHQRDDLQQQLQVLQAKVAQQTQAMASLRGQADMARHDLETLRQQHAVEQATSDQAKQAQQQALDASQRRAAEAEKQAATEQAALDQLRAEAERQKHLAETQQIVKPAQATAESQSATEQAPLDHLKAEAERHLPEAQQLVKPAPATEENQAATEQAASDQLKVEAQPQKQLPASQQVVKPAPTTPIVRQGAAAKVASNASPTPPSARSDPDLPDAVVNRLRRESRTHNQLEQDAARALAPPAAPAPAPQERLPQGPLYAGRAALAAGRLDEARQALEQAQVQLASWPVGPYDETSSNGSVAAGQVAEALSMLGAGDIPHAMQYIDLAIAQRNRQAGLPLARPVPLSGDGVPAQTNGAAQNDQYSQTMLQH